MANNTFVILLLFSPSLFAAVPTFLPKNKQHLLEIIIHDQKWMLGSLRNRKTAYVYVAVLCINIQILLLLSKQFLQMQLREQNHTSSTTSCCQSLQCNSSGMFDLTMRRNQLLYDQLYDNCLLNRSRKQIYQHFYSFQSRKQLPNGTCLNKCQNSTLLHPRLLKKNNNSHLLIQCHSALGKN